MHVAHSTATSRRMPLVPALEVLRDWRTDEIVITTMGAAREWPNLSQHPLDFHYIPSAMGHAPMLALGVALAKPQREVIAFNGDGCMLMGLSCLVTIGASRAKNLSVVVLENGVYEVTGGQRTAAADLPVDFCGMARSAGFATVARLESLDDWRAHAGAILAGPGPRFLVLSVERVKDYVLNPPGPIKPRLETFRQALAGV